MEKAIELLSLYKEFQEQGMPDNFANFGDWLNNKFQAEENYLTNEEEVNLETLDVRVGYMLGALTSYLDTWIKLAYQELPLVSIGDFAILKTVEFMPNPTKKMIADQVVMERSTCNESIKRLVKEELLEEEVDPEDRRQRRVSLSPKGRQIIQILNKKMSALGKFMMSSLSGEEKKAIFTPIKKLLDFHEHTYKQLEKEVIKEKYGL